VVDTTRRRLSVKEEVARKVHISGDGTAWGTRVTDAETGEMIRGVQAIEFSLNAQEDPQAKAKLTLRGPYIGVSLTIDAERKERWLLSAHAWVWQGDDLDPRERHNFSMPIEPREGETLEGVFNRVVEALNSVLGGV
jgi:hypothetical protein